LDDYSFRISIVDLQQLFVRQSRLNSFVVPNFTAETFVEPDAEFEKEKNETRAMWR